MPNIVDGALVAVLVIWSIWDHFVAWPRFARDAAAGRPGARTRHYGGIGIAEWVFAAAILATWAHFHRPPDRLGLAVPAGVRLLAGGVVCAVAAGLLLLQFFQIRALTPERRARARARLSGPVLALLPHTPAESAAFTALSLTAGFCEELMARGYLIWFFAAWTGTWPALVISSVLFGLAHGYQGRSGVLKTGAVGLAMGLLYLGTRSLLPGMLMHALIDVGSGLAGYALVRETPAA